MKNTLLIAVAIGTVFALTAGALAMDTSETRFSRVETPIPPVQSLESARLETLWIFDADFSDLSGDNAGWTSFDRSGTLASANYWHHDTIRINGFAHLGDSTWWCGTYNTCWRQSRGYGNDWLQILERSFTEASGLSGGTALYLEYDQRFAMENDYDYGFTEISTDGGANWDELWRQCNPGFAGQPGTSQDWDSVHFEGGGHILLDLTSYAGQNFDLRFRFESDGAYSSQDEYNNPPFNSVLDGAWQLDNIRLYAFTPDSTVLYYDDAESNGDNGWVHDDLEASGQTSVAFFRGRFGIDFVTGRDFTCEDRPVGSWMYAAVDPFTSAMVDDENTWLVSPPIDVSGAAKLVGHWDEWVDLPRPTEDVFNLSLASNDLYECVTDPAGFIDESPGAWYGGPFWGNWYDDWDAFAGNDWLAVRWELWNSGETNNVPPHMAGIFVNRQRVGIPSGDAGTTWNYSVWTRLHDWYQEQLADAQADTNAVINVKDDDDIVAVTLYADNGTTQSTYPCVRVNPEGNDWRIPAPTAEIIPGVEIHYWFEAEDGVGNFSLQPSTAPDNYYEMSILPINFTVSTPGLLLVDKHGRATPSAARDYFHSSEYYYREMLGILGYTWDKYDVEVPSGSTEQSNGPDSSAFKYYDTQIWFTDEFDAYTIKAPDQENLISWLNQSQTLGKERNLLITGNDWGKELEVDGKETLNFYQQWMASDFIANEVGVVTTDSVPGIEEAPGGYTFMDYDDAEAILRGGCPQLHYYDVVGPQAGLPGSETAVQYKRLDSVTRPAGVAYTHPTSTYQTVNLGFGMEFIADGTVGGGASNYTPEGYFKCGVEDRVNLMGNIMAYFGQTPPGPGTGVDVIGGNKLSYAYPNPFNPVTKIAYSVKEAGPVTIDVYNVAGKVVRTLLDTEVDAGASGFVVWDGTNDGGEKCASGVYFYRISAPNFTQSNKMIMLK
jgi:hypothetical protein